MWATLPDDLLVDILRRLEASAVLRCAATCRPWRRAVIDSASCLRPRPDCFNPNLLMGFLEKNFRFDQQWRHTLRRLQYVPASNKELPFFRSESAASVDDDVVDDGRACSDLVASRDGFLLFQGYWKNNSLCLCRPLTGTCRPLPAAAFDDIMGACVYALFTSYDVDENFASGNDGNGDEPAVWILAVEPAWVVEDGMAYQIFSSTSGAWGPIKRSAKFPGDVAGMVFIAQSSGMAVCGGAVHWLVSLISDNPERRPGFCMFAMDLRTERTWTTEVPDLGSPIVATSADGRLSVVDTLYSSSSPQMKMEMEVWVLGCDGQWTLQRTVDVPNMILDLPSWIRKGFCPRSGCLFGMSRDEQDVQHHLLIGVEGGFTQLIRKIGYEDNICDTVLPYEMDWSTYISKLKCF